MRTLVPFLFNSNFFFHEPNRSRHQEALSLPRHPQPVFPINSTLRHWGHSWILQLSQSQLKLMPKDSVLSIFILPLIASSYSRHCTLSSAFLTSWFATSELDHQKKYWYMSQRFPHKQVLIAKAETRAHKWKQRRRKRIDFSEAAGHLIAWTSLRLCTPPWLSAASQHDDHDCFPYRLVSFFFSVQTTACPSYSCFCMHRPSILVLLKLCHALLALGHNPHLLPTIAIWKGIY